jgi:D-amino-acid oxidase
VNIVTAALSAQTTSAKAAAIWFPYAVFPKDKASSWSKESFDIFQNLCAVPQSGVSMVPLSILIEREEDAWWKDAFPAGALRLADPDELPAAYSLAYLADVPLVETQLYLNYLLNSFLALGGRIKVEVIENPLALLENSDWVINCSGLGARELVSDSSLYPIQGQIVKAEKQAGVACIIADFTFGDQQQDLAYVVVREDCIVLGGTNVKKAEETAPDKLVTQGIIARCRQIAPSLKDVKIKTVEVGLRPGRPEIRLEKEGRMIHNYGHGGGGYTVSWGCARAVLDLLR